MPKSNGLQSQPLDILISISQILDHESLLRLRLVSRSLSLACTPYALRHVAIVFKGKQGELVGKILERFYGFRDNLEMVQTLARHSHRLTIHSVGYDFGREGLVPVDAIDAICEGLKRFKSIKSLCLKWKHGYSDSFPGTGVFINNLQDRFCDSILEATGYSLEELTLIPGPDPPLYIPASLAASSLGLRSFQIELDKWGWYCLDPKYPGNFGFGVSEGGNQREDQNKCPYPDCDPLPLIAIHKIVQSNPTLERLHIIHGCILKGFGPEYIFPQRSNPSPLTSLIIKGFNPTSVSSLIPANSLCNLTHLTAQNPASQFKYDILWSSLKAAHTELKSLATCQISHSLCIYLASYNSLQELVITEIENDADSCSEKTVSAFFDDALPQHAETLRKLKVTYSSLVVHDAGWALSKNRNNRWGRALFKLTALTSLHIEPRCTLDLSDPEDFSYGWPTAAPLIQEYRTTLDYIAEVAPQVDTVEFLWPDVQFGFGRDRLEWIDRREEIIGEVGRAMDRLSGGPERLVLNDRMYQLAFDRDKEVFVYRVCV